MLNADDARLLCAEEKTKVLLNGSAVSTLNICRPSFFLIKD